MGPILLGLLPHANSMYLNRHLILYISQGKMQKMKTTIGI